MTHSMDACELALTGDTSPEIREALISLITRFVKAQKHNDVVLLKANQINDILEAHKLCANHASLIQRQDVWGLKLRINPCRDECMDKTWIKKLNIWYRMLNIAGDQATIAYKGAQEPDSLPFRLASEKSAPYPGMWFESSEILLEALGPSALLALQEAITA